MVTNAQLTMSEFQVAIKNADTFNAFEKYKQQITSTWRNTKRLYDYYAQAVRGGLECIKSNQNLSRKDFELIQEIINK